jgi:hypothetical protein
MGTPARYYSSTAVTTTLSLSISSTDVAIQVASSSGFPSSYPFTLILAKDSANEEILTVTALVGSQFTVTRGVDGTSARSHTAGTSVEHGVSALDFTDQRSHQAAAANVHDIGATASVVGTDTSQTLTNKTLTSTTLGGDLAAGTNKITGLGDPAAAQDAATKNYVDTGASSQVVAATTQATNAATSATAAAASATAAATSESNSANSATASANSATASNSSQTASASSETNAAASAAAALVSQNSATSSAASATSSASSATASQSASATSETNAAASAVAAAASAASAAATYDQFDDRFLGVKTSSPSLDNDGNALVAGALFFNSTDNTMYVYSGSSWLAVNTGTFIAETLIDAKGDLVVGSANDTAARLAVGTDGFVLTADAAEATGVKWAASSGGGGSTADVFLLMGA